MTNATRWLCFLTPIYTLFLACTATEQSSSPPAPGPQTAPAVEYSRFVEIATSVGLDWHHENGFSSKRHFPETMGGGGALFDYDSDGDLDVYAVNGAYIAASPRTPRPVNALFRNDGAARAISLRDDAAGQNAGVRFQFTPIPAGVDHTGVGMGVAAADYDADGDLDLYLTNFGPNALFRNDGSHCADAEQPCTDAPVSFAAVAAAAAVDDPRWGTSCAFSDYDRDGDLDLYVANYVHYDPQAASADPIPYMAEYESYSGDAPPGYPHPDNFPGQTDLLYRNDGDRGFADVSSPAGIADDGGKGLGVVFADYDGDGWPDIYVANDAVRNFLYHNQRNGTFAERASPMGVAYGQDGQMEAGMGVDWGDYDGDGILDLTVTNFQAEPNALYRGEHTFFSVATYSAGIGLPSLPLLGFGTQFFDSDLDGDLDLFVANGHVLDNVELVDQSTSYGQRNLLFRNDKGRFSDISDLAGPGFHLARASRGSAAGDYDLDGDTDLLVFNSGQPLSLLRNDRAGANHWLTVRLKGKQGNPNGIGARLFAYSGVAEADTAVGDLVAPVPLLQTREMRGSRSYLSQSELSVSFGLGTRERLDRLEVRWPSGRNEHFGPFAADQFLTLVEGQGITAVAAPP